MWVSSDSKRIRLTDQGAEQIDGLQNQFLVSDPGHAQLLQVLVCDLQQLLSADLLPLEVAHILLEAVIQTWVTQDAGSKQRDSLGKLCRSMCYSSTVVCRTALAERETTEAQPLDPLLLLTCGLLVCVQCR